MQSGLSGLFLAIHFAVWFESLRHTSVAVYMLLGRVVREHVSTTVYTYLVYMVCAGTLLLMCLFQGHRIFRWCLKYFSPSFVSASKLCEPVVAAILAGILFEEVPSLLQVWGGALILGGVFYYFRIEKENS